jgi:hypothetical protein
MNPGIPRLLRTWVVAAALAAVAAASLLDGDAADLVADGDGEWFLLHSQTAPSISAATDPRPSDLCAARKRALVLPDGPPRSDSPLTPSRSERPSSVKGPALPDVASRLSRAPPLG